MQFPVPVPANGIQLRCDLKPFSDISVRTVMQMAMNLPEIAKGYYKGVDWKPWGTAGTEAHGINSYGQFISCYSKSDSSIENTSAIQMNFQSVLMS